MHSYNLLLEQQQKNPTLQGWVLIFLERPAGVCTEGGVELSRLGELTIKDTPVPNLSE